MCKKMMLCGTSLLGVVIWSLFLVACTSQNEENSDLSINLTGSVDGMKSRVNVNGFDDGNLVGIYVVDYNGANAGSLEASGNRATNVCHVFTNGNFEPSDRSLMTWGNTKVDIYGYFPYESVSPVDVKTYFFSVKTDQNGANGYDASDFLYSNNAKAKSATSERIPLIFSHALCKIIVNVNYNDEIIGKPVDKTSLKINGTVCDAIVNLRTGSVRGAQGAGEANIVPRKAVMPNAGYDITYEAILVPQTVEAGKDFITVTVDGKDYVYSLSGALNLLKGFSYIYNISVGRKAIKTSLGGIEDWNVAHWQGGQANVQPTTVRIAVGRDAKLSVDEQQGASYRWQMYMNDGWSDLNDIPASATTPEIRGAKTRQLLLMKVPRSWDGLKFRCVINTSLGSLYEEWILYVRECFDINVSILLGEGIIPDKVEGDVVDGWFYIGTKIVLQAKIALGNNSETIINPKFKWIVDGEPVDKVIDTSSSLTLTPELWEADMVIKVGAHCDGACDTVYSRPIRLKALPRTE